MHSKPTLHQPRMLESRLYPVASTFLACPNPDVNLTLNYCQRPLYPFQSGFMSDVKTSFSCSVFILLDYTSSLSLVLFYFEVLDKEAVTLHHLASERTSQCSHMQIPLTQPKTLTRNIQAMCVFHGSFWHQEITH